MAPVEEAEQIRYTRAKAGFGDGEEEAAGHKALPVEGSGLEGGGEAPVRWWLAWWQTLGWAGWSVPEQDRHAGPDVWIWSVQEHQTRTGLAYAEEPAST